jgi:hypothetical protein
MPWFSVSELGLTPSNPGTAGHFSTLNISSASCQECSMSLTKDFLRVHQIMLVRKNVLKGNFVTPGS